MPDTTDTPDTTHVYFSDTSGWQFCYPLAEITLARRPGDDAGPERFYVNREGDAGHEVTGPTFGQILLLLKVKAV